MSPAATREMITQSGSSQIPMPLKNDSPKSPISAKLAARNAEYVPSSAQHAKKPARGPRVTPASAYADPAWLKKLVSRMNAYETSAIATEARRKARGTARPTMLAG